MKQFNLIIMLFIFLLGSTYSILFYPFALFKDQLKDLNFWRNKLSEHQYSTIILGDSRVYRGINPSVFKDSYNFAFSSNSYKKAYLEEALLRCKNKCQIILGVTPQSLTNYQGIDSFIKYKQIYSNPIMYSYEILRIIFPNFPIYGSVKKEIKKIRDYKQKDLLAYHSNGWIETKPTNFNQSNGEHFYKDSFSKDKFSQTILKTLLTFIRENKDNVDFYFFFPPTSKEVFAIENTVRLSHFHRELIIGTLIKNGAKYINTAEYHTMPTYDGDHLKSEDASLFSSILIQELKKIKEAP